MAFIEQQLQRQFHAGDVIFKDGDAGQSMFILLDGEVEISKVLGDHRTILASLSKGSIFGEMAIINRRPRSATARATSPVVALEISRSMFEKRLEEVPKWMRGFFGIMAERLREATDRQSTDSPEDIARQFIAILAMLSKQTDADNQDRIVLPWNETVATLAFLMGVDTTSVNDMANKLVTAKLAKSDKREKVGRVLIFEHPDEMEQFAQFCKEQYLVAGGHLEEYSEPFRFSSPHEVKILAVVDALMQERGSVDDFPQDALASALQAKFNQPMAYFKESLDKMVAEGVIDIFQPDSSDSAYRVNNRELFSERIKKMKLVQELHDLVQKLSE